MLGAVVYGQKHFQPVIDAIVKLAERAAKEPWELKLKESRGVATQCATPPKPACAMPMRFLPSTSAATALPKSRRR